MMGRASTVTAATLQNANIKYWQWSFSLFLLTLVYLVIGAFIFRATEEDSVKVARTKLYTEAYFFILTHPCLSGEDLASFGANLTIYLARGASMHSGHWIDSDAEEIPSSWTLSAAFIFSLTIITTIGYGNIVPRTQEGRLFCIAYALIGIPLMAFTLTIFGKSCNRLTKKYLKAMNRLRKYIKRGRPRLVVQSLVTIFLVSFILVICPGLITAHLKNWQYLDSMYFYFITVSTIGFGDIVIEECTKCGRSLWIFVILYSFYVFMGICVISLVFTAFGDYQKKKLAKVESLVVTFVKVKRHQVIRTAHLIKSHVVTETSCSRDDGGKADNADTAGRKSDHDSDNGIVNLGLEGDAVEFSADVHEDPKPTYTFVEVQCS